MNQTIAIFMKYLFHASMDIKSLKLELIKWLTELQDTSMLETLKRLKEKGEDKLTTSQREVLQERLHQYESGEITFSTWKDTKEQVRHRGKDGV